MFSHYDVMSVGEVGSVTPEEGLKFTGTDKHELNMIFHFQHMELDQQPGTIRGWSWLHQNNVFQP